MRSRRPLGSFERAQALTGESFAYNLVAVIGLEQGLDRERLRWALDEIQRRTPLLQARLDGSDRGAAFLRAAEAAPIPLRLVDGDPERWAGVVEEELARRFDARREPLARCALLAPSPSRPASGSALVLSFHHVIADGVGVARLARDLLSLAAGAAAPGRPAVADLPPSADERFPPRFSRAGGGWAAAPFLLRQAADEIAFRWRRRRRPERPAPPSSRCRVLTTTLPAGETAAVARAGRRRRVSLTAALEAAMLLAVSRRRYAGARTPLRYFVFPLLRPYLEPPIEEDAFASYVTTMRFTVEVAGDDDLWALAAAVGRQIHQAARRGDKYLSSIWSPLSMKMMLRQTSRRMGTTAVSYTGPVDLSVSTAAGAAGLGVRSVHAFVSNLPLGPEYAAQVRLYRGRLVWDVVYLDGEMTRDEAWAIARDMKECLVAAATARRSPG